MRQAEAEIPRLAYYDTLIGLPNRAYFQQSLIPVGYTSRPILNEEGLPEGTVVTFRGVDEYKFAERELQKHLQELDRFNELAVARELRMIDVKQ